MGGPEEVTSGVPTRDGNVAKLLIRKSPGLGHKFVPPPPQLSSHSGLASWREN